MSTMLEKLNLVREAEEKAAAAFADYRRAAEETLSKAQAESERFRKEEEAKAREEGEREMRAIIERAGNEAEELRAEYMRDSEKLLALVGERRKEAVDFLVERLERGEEETGEQGQG